MKKCEFCQEELAEDVNVCPNCGKSVLQQKSEEENETAEITQEAETVEEAPAEMIWPVTISRYAPSFVIFSVPAMFS